MVGLNIGKTSLSIERSVEESFRRTLIQSFLFKFYSYVNESSDVDCRPYQRAISHAQQTMPERPASQKIVGDSISHRSAYLHTTGEAIYLDDMPSLIDTLHAALVLSRKPNARIKHIGEKIESTEIGRTVSS